MHVGVAGLGKMGAAIALHLLETGNQVTVWNRTPEKTASAVAAGAAAVGAAEAIATGAAALTPQLSCIKRES